MLSKSAVSAVARIGNVNQRAFSLSRMNQSEIVPACGLVEAKVDHIDLKAVDPTKYTQEMKDLYYPQIGNSNLLNYKYKSSHIYRHSSNDNLVLIFTCMEMTMSYGYFQL